MQKTEEGGKTIKTQKSIEQIVNLLIINEKYNGKSKKQWYCCTIYNYT